MRFVLSILMIGGFIFILYLGPLALVLLVSTSSAILYLVLGCSTNLSISGVYLYVIFYFIWYKLQNERAFIHRPYFHSYTTLR